MLPVNETLRIKRKDFALRGESAGRIVTGIHWAMSWKGSLYAMS